MAGENEVARKSTDQPAAPASKALYRGDKLTPREARLLTRPVARKQKRRTPSEPFSRS